MVVVEAMAAGVPVAASRIGGVPDLIEHGINGMMWNPADPSDMARTVEWLLADGAFARRLAEEGRRRARARFLPAVVAYQHLDIYREILSSR